MILKHDPQEDDPLIKAKIDEAKLEVEKILADVPKTRGFSNRFSKELKRILREKYNIDWKTPSEMNPGMIID